MAEENNSSLGVFNPSKDIAKEVTLQVLIRHRDAMQLSREGIIFGEKVTNDNEKKLNKIKGLYQVIASQREMINISRPIVNYSCLIKWKRKYETEEKQSENPFEKEDNDYNVLIKIREILSQAELDMIKAEQTTCDKDDYLTEKQTPEGIRYVLTLKYFEMLNGLEDTYEKIYSIMLKHKIVSAGIEEDEILSYKELEKEAIRRIVEA